MAAGSTSPVGCLAVRRLLARAAAALGAAARPARVPGQPEDSGEPETTIIAEPADHVPGEASENINDVAAEGQGDGGSEARRTWYFAVPLESKHPEKCIQALSRIIAELRRLFEGADVVYRAHGDRASELTGERVRAHFAEKGIVVASTSGYEPNENRRAEKGVGNARPFGRARCNMPPGAPGWRQMAAPRAVRHSARRPRLE